MSISPVRFRSGEGKPGYQESIKMGRICWKSRFWAWSEKWRSDECWEPRWWCQR